MEMAAAATRIRWLAWSGAFGLLAFTGSVVALHVVAPGDAPWHMSGFANGDYWLLWGFALYALLAGGIAITAGLARSLRPSAWTKASLGLLLLCGIGGLLVAVFPMDRGAQARTLSGAIHNDAAMGTFALLALTMAVMAPAFRRTPGWRSLAWPSVGMGLLVAASCTVYMVATYGRLPLASLSQRVLVAVIVAWFGMVAGRLLRPAPMPVPTQAEPVPILPPRPAAPEAVAVPVTHGPVRVRMGRPARPRRIPLEERGTARPRRATPLALQESNARAAARRAGKARRAKAKPRLA